MGAMASQITRISIDGHCFVHSVINCNSVCHGLGNLQYGKFLEDIVDETERNVDTYRCFVDDRSITQLRVQMHDYVRNKKYNSRYGDLVLLITANLLNVNIMIIEHDSGANTLRHVAPTVHQGMALGLILLYKKEDYYDACTPSHVTEETSTLSVNVSERQGNHSCDVESSSTENKFSEYNIKFGHVNARSLYPKLDEINYIVMKHDFDIFCISETWLGDQFKNSDVDIPDYDIYRKDRDGALGGGVCIYIYKEPFHC